MTKQKSQEKKKDREQKKSIGIRKEEIVRSIKATEKFITIRDSGELLYFNPSDGQWYDGGTYAEEFTRDKAGVDYSTSLLREVRETLRVDTYTDGKSFVSPPEWINLKNGALNVLTSEFIPRDPEPECKEEHKKIEDVEKAREKEQGQVAEGSYLMGIVDVKQNFANFSVWDFCHSAFFLLMVSLISLINGSYFLSNLSIA